MGDALFFSTHGVKKLPQAYLLLTAVMIPLSLLYGALSTRFSYLTMNIFFALATAATGLLFFYPLAGGGSAAAFPFYLAKEVLYIFTVASFWAYLGYFFETRASKRLYPLFMVGAGLGGILGGLLVHQFAGRMPANQLALIWSMAALLTIPLSLFLSRRYKPLDGEGEQESAPHTGALASLTELISYIGRLPYARHLIFGIFIIELVFGFIEYQFFDIFSRRYPAQDELTSFLGSLSALLSGGKIILSVVITPLLVLRLGVKNISLIQPIASIGALGLFVFSSGLGAGIYGKFTNECLDEAVDDTNWSLLYNLIPLRMRGKLIVLLDGIISPMGMAFCGLSLLALQDYVAPRYLAMIGMALGVIYLAFSFMLRRSYVSTLMDEIDRRRLDITQLSRTELGRPDKRVMAQLQVMLFSDDPESALFAAETLALSSGKEGRALLFQALERPETAVKTGLMKLLADHLLWDSDVANRIKALLAHEEPVIRALAVRLLHERKMLSDRELEPFLDDSAPRVQAEAALLLKGAGRAMGVVEGLLSSDDEVIIYLVFEALDALQAPFMATLLAPYLKDKRPGIRAAAARALSEQADPKMTFLLPLLIEALSDEDREVRIHATTALCLISSPATVPMLVKMVPELPYRERKQVGRSLAMMGMPAWDQLKEVITDRRINHIGRQLALSAASLIQPPELRSFLEAEVKVESRLAYRLSLCQDAVGVLSEAADLLSLLLSERVWEHTSVVLHMLEVLYGTRELDKVRRAIIETGSQGERAQAVEALEDALGRSALENILPLIEPGHAKVPVAYAEKELGITVRLKDETLAWLAQYEDPWIQAVAIHAIGALKLKPLGAIVSKAVESEDPIVAETARAAERRLRC